MENKQKQIERHIKGMDKHVQKQKLRKSRQKVGFNKKPKKPRIKKISPITLERWDEIDELEFDSFEPIMPQESREQRRKNAVEVLKIDNHKKPFGGSGSDETGLTSKSNLYQGLVIEAASGVCRVDLHGEIYFCDIRGHIKESFTGYINPVAVGDDVMISKNGKGRGVVEAVLPRRSVLSRPYSPDEGKIIEDLEQIVVANVDQLLIVASWREPYIWPGIIDRYLIAAQRNKIKPVICINKIDLIKDHAEFNATIKVYKELGYSHIFTSATGQFGIEELKETLKDCTTVLAGLSGVGKSTLLTAIQPSLNLKTGTVSQHGLFTGQGRHTTTHASLLKLDNGGIVMDTPGVRGFALAGINPLDLASWYPEMVPYIQNCRFSNCSHINEINCSLVTAVEQGKVSELRYKNYTKIYAELSD
jgi:ribosome biogenesis GTPase